MKIKTILITGGTGFLGRSLVAGLVGAGHRLRILDNDSRGSVRKLEAIAKRVEFVSGDIRDSVAVRRAVEGAEAVFHLAYINGTEFFYTRPEEILEVAVKGMVNVLDACRAEGVRELFLASSSEVYQNPPRVPTDESAPLTVPDVLNPRFSYGGGKIISELLALNYGRKDFDRVVVFRPHNVYGPDMGREHVLPQFSLRLRNLFREQPAGIPDFPIQGSGKETRAFIHIRDFTQALLLLLEKGRHREIYHLGTENEITIADLASLVAREGFGREIRIVPGPLQEGSPPRRCPDTRKIRALGFQPAVPLPVGVAETARWYAEKTEGRILRS
jgi:nucleoside-diphosphate-sugar epimerase